MHTHGIGAGTPAASTMSWCWSNGIGVRVVSTLPFIGVTGTIGRTLAATGGVGICAGVFLVTQLLGIGHSGEKGQGIQTDEQDDGSGGKDDNDADGDNDNNHDDHPQDNGADCATQGEGIATRSIAMQAHIVHHCEVRRIAVSLCFIT